MTTGVILGFIVILFTAAINLVNTFLNRSSSRQYKDALDREFLAKETGYTSQLDSKDERIKLLELIADPDYRELISTKIEEKESVIEKQKLDILSLQNTIKKLIREKKELISSNAELQNRIPYLKLSDLDRKYLQEFVTVSNSTITQIGGTVDALSSVENELISNTEMIKNVTVLDVESVNHAHVATTPALTVADETIDETPPE